MFCVVCVAGLLLINGCSDKMARATSSCRCGEEDAGEKYLQS